MTPEIRELIEISKLYGNDRRFVIAGGGNTSFKDESTIWIKASGESLADMNENSLVALDRQKLREISVRRYSADPVVREEQVKNDMAAAIAGADRSKRPSVETSLHEIIGFRFVIHLHPSIINGILCSRNAKNLSLQLFGDKVLFVPYTDPGYTLFKKLETEIKSYREHFSSEPAIILLENHGVFVGADTTAGIKNIYDELMQKAGQKLNIPAAMEPLPYNPVLHKVLPVFRMVLAGNQPGIARFRYNRLIEKSGQNQQEFNKISHPLTPDHIVYCKPHMIYIEHSDTAAKILDSFRHQLPRFIAEYGYPPKIIVIRNMGVIAVDESYSKAETVLDVYEDLIMTSHYASQTGGIKFLTPQEADFIDKWEVENYRRKVSKAAGLTGRMTNKIAIVTGAARGFGAGIAEALYRQNMNVVLADMDEETGIQFTKKLISEKAQNKAVFFKTDVSDPESVKSLVIKCVSEFGGLDLMVSNAGILKAGGLDEMDPEAFERTTRINYNGYFYCAKFASEIMKLQNDEKPEHFTDIIQINSKSGLKGSNRNFAYAGSKFGGIGLTQSFALELAPFRIKVNSICPGNFYEGPLWSDPQNGLFIQYLKAGKVPGARNIDDVRKFYEEQVPMKRGCRLEDVMKALFYIIDQEYETGQAVPVTGGQIMLG
jgi:NAD(P)-dependent dehydrogenase (short-subunit alcohol dehydrogenase family)/rhamnose utilization protein RhaD (predicted bifunctional aldolase and dehydrogenase)